MTTNQLPNNQVVDDETFVKVNQEYKKNTTPSYIVEPQQPKLEEKIVFIRNQVNGSIFPVEFIKGAKNKVVMNGLPQEINNYSFNYTDVEKWENPLEVIECLVTMHATFNDGITETMDTSDGENDDEPGEMPTE